MEYTLALWISNLKKKKHFLEWQLHPPERAEIIPAIRQRKDSRRHRRTATETITSIEEKRFRNLRGIF